MTHWLTHDELVQFIEDKCDGECCCPRCKYYEIQEMPHREPDSAVPELIFMTAVCRRFPPSQYIRGEQIWISPEVETWDWCGEYVNRPGWQGQFLNT